MIFGWGKKKKDQKAEDAKKDEGLASSDDVSQTETAPETPAPETPVVQDDTPAHAPTELPVEAPHNPVEVEPAPVLEDAPTAERMETQAVEAAPEAVEEPSLELDPEPAAELISVPEAEAEAASQPEPEPEKKKGFFSRLAQGLKKSSSKLSDSVSKLFTTRKLDDEALEDLEEILIAADLGAVTAAKVTTQLAKDRFDKEVTDVEIKEALAEVVADTLKPFEKPFSLEGAHPQVILFVGVNGSGKTTTLGKIAVKLTREGKKVVTAAGDTFRAAAVEQLQVWSDRAGAHFMSREIGADAAGLAFDAVKEAKDQNADVVLIDTAGRLQNKTELMDELRKIMRVIAKVDPEAPHQVVLVLDGTVGSNALSQAEAFLEASNVSGVVMTKLDGTAKGGALVQVAQKFKLPIHYIGVGEGEEDLQDFNARDFARALAGLDQD